MYYWYDNLVNLFLYGYYEDDGKNLVFVKKGLYIKLFFNVLVDDRVVLILMFDSEGSYIGMFK